MCGSLLWSTIEIPLGLAPGCSSSVLSTRGGKDLPLQCHLIEPKMGSAKCKFTGTTHPDQPKAKKGIPTSKTKKTKKGTLTSKKAPPKKLPKPLQPKKQPPPKKVPKKRKRAGSDDEQPHKKSHSGDDIIEAHNLPSLRYKFYPVDEQWQRDKCDFLGLQFHCKNGVSPGGPDVPLTPPDQRAIKHIVLDGNCFFRSICYIVTGSEEQHMAIRTAIVNHMLHLAEDDHNFTEHPSVEQYIVDTGMNEDGTWATTNEMVAVAHLLRTCLFSYNMEDASWHRFTPQNVEVNYDDDVPHMCMYIRHPTDHFDVVLSVLQN